MTSAAQTVPPAVRTDPIGVFPIGPPLSHTHPPLVAPATPAAVLPAPPVTAPPVPVQIAGISPDTAVTNWSSANISNWPTTPTAFERRASLLNLTKTFSGVNESDLLLALELHDHNYQDAYDFLLGMGPKSEILEFLYKIFPDVPRDVVTSRARDNAGRSLATFSSLVREFHSSWRPIPPPFLWNPVPFSPCHISTRLPGRWVP